MKTKVLLILLFLFSSNLFAYDKFVNPNSDGNNFSDAVIPLSTGNVVITSPAFRNDDGINGVVYLFNGKTGELISSLYGGKGNMYWVKISLLPNGDFIVACPNWGLGKDSINCGSVTYVNGKTGFNGTVDSTNSIIGTHPNDEIGSGGIIVLHNGNYLINSPNWKEDGINSYGAFTFCKFNTKLHGKISIENSLVGNKKFNLNYNNKTFVLSNNNYLIQTTGLNNSALTCVKSITWGSGEYGLIGTIADSNSLIVGDSIDYGKELLINEVKNSNYIIIAKNWYKKNLNALGAITWCAGTKPTVGYIDSTNSMIGLNLNPNITITKNGDYLICSPSWKNELNDQFGALTWCNGAKGKFGRISPQNSIIGNSSNDVIANSIRAINYNSLAIVSNIYISTAKKSLSVFTYFGDNYNISGKFDTTNSLITNYEYAELESIDTNSLWGVSYETYPGNIYNTYLTKMNASNMIKGVVNEKNSLLIQDKQNTVFPKVTILENGNTIISYGTRGFITLFKKNDEITGVLDTNKCIKSSSANLQFLRIRPLTNGKYLIITSNSVTLCDNDKYLSGVIDETNSFTGSCYDVVVLSNNNYLIVNPFWSSGVSNAGAITFCKGDKPFLEPVNKSNSLIGVNEYDNLGLKVIQRPYGLEYVLSVYPLNNGNYIIHSPRFHNIKNYEVGAITWGSGETGVTGEISSKNSLTTNDTLSSLGCNIFEFPNGNCLVSSEKSFSSRGTMTWIDGNKGISGYIDQTNSIIGSGNGDMIGYYLKPVLTNSPNESFYIVNRYFGHSSKKGRGCITFGNNKTGFHGEISELNSLIAPYIDFHDINDNSIYSVCFDSVNHLIYIVFKTEYFVHVLGADNNLEVLDTKSQTKDMKISPNPCTDYINVEFDLEDYASITLDVLSYDGRLIKNDYLGYKLAGKVNINKSISDLPTGNYILRLKYNDVSAVKSFSVVR